MHPSLSIFVNNHSFFIVVFASNIVSLHSLTYQIYYYAIYCITCHLLIYSVVMLNNKISFSLSLSLLIICIHPYVFIAHLCIHLCIHFGTQFGIYFSVNFSIHLYIQLCIHSCIHLSIHICL